MRFSLSSGTLFTFPLPKAFEMARAAGFDGLELIINQEFQRVNSSTLIRELAEIHPIHSIHAPFMPLDGWGGPVDMLRRCVELAVEAGIGLVNFHPPSWLGFEIRYWRWLFHVFDFQKEVGRENVQVTIENMPWVGKFKINPHVLSATEKMVEFITERNLYMTFDTTHLGSGKTNFINDFYVYYNSGRIRNIHFSDYGHGKEHLIPGHGILPLTRFLNHLSQTGYDGSFTLELSPHEFPHDEKVIVEMLKEIRAYLEKETQPQAPDAGREARG
jgi:sugar phosphate isomerase/epimerase